MKLLATLLSVLFMAGICMAETKPAWSATERQIAEKQIFDQLNQERQGVGLPVLEWNEQAAQAARTHAQAMVENGQLSHQFLGEPSLVERIGATGARFTLAAENVARTGFVEDVHPALMNSHGHRANILNSAYNAVGIGVVERQGKIYVAQDFLYLVPMYSEEQFGAVFAEAFKLARKSKGRKPINAMPDASLHDLACMTEGDATKLADKVSKAIAVVVFNSSEPHRLPEEMMGRVANPEFHRMNFGVCFRPDQEHGYANFWVVITFHAG
jgi:uncharacterized protein YkwD